MTDVLAKEEVNGIDAYWRAANYPSVRQIYLLDNSLLTEPLALEHVKPRLLGHWGTNAGACSRRRSIRTACRAASSTPCSPPTSRSSSPITAIRGGFTG